MAEATKAERGELKEAPSREGLEALASEVSRLAKDLKDLGSRVERRNGEISSLKKAPGAVPPHTHDYVAPSALAGFVPRKEWVEWGKGVVGALDSVRRELAALKEEKAGAGQFADKKAVDEFARGVGVRFRVVDKSLDQLTALLARVKEIEGFLRANVELGLLEIPKGGRALRQRNPSTLGSRGQQT